MYKSNIQRYQDQFDQVINFSFSQPKYKIPKPQPFLMKPSQKKDLGMWIKTVLECHSQQFIHALKHCRKLSIVELNQYMEKHYQHLKVIIRYYIIAALMDYGQVQQRQYQEKNENQCIFLNTVIQELAYRFFRQSQWLHKICHLQSYQLFHFFDYFLKGFITIREIEQKTAKQLTGQPIIKAQTSLKKELSRQNIKKLEMLVHLKFTNNLEQYDSRISQQNFQEVMLRVNLINFEDVFTHRINTRGSWKYQFIDNIIKENEVISTDRHLQRVNDEVSQIQKEKQQLQLMKQEYSIRYKSQLMSHKTISNEVYSQQPRQMYCKSTGFDDITASTPQPSRYPKITYPESGHSQERKSILSQRNPNIYQGYCDSAIKKNEIKDFNERVFDHIQAANTIELQNQVKDGILVNNMVQIERKKQLIATRDIIFQELQILQQEKRKNHAKMLRYL